MLKVGKEIQLPNGLFTTVVVTNCKYSPKYKCNYMTYITLDDPENTKVVPLKKEGNISYADYSYSEKEIEDMVKGISLPSIIKTEEKIISYSKKDNKYINSIINDETMALSLPKKVSHVISLDETISLELPKIKSKVVDVSPVEVEEMSKQNVLYVSLNNETHMLFRVEDSLEKEYVCTRISDKELIDNQDKYAVLKATLSLVDFYNLKGESNITSLNNTTVKIPKSMIIDENEHINLLMIEYNGNSFYPFLIENETDNSYEILETDRNFIANHPYELVVVEILSEEDFIKFKNDYSKSKNKRLPISLLKKGLSIEKENMKEEIVKRAA